MIWHDLKSNARIIIVEWTEAFHKSHARYTHPGSTILVGLVNSQYNPFCSIVCR